LETASKLIRQLYSGRRQDWQLCLPVCQVTLCSVQNVSLGGCGMEVAILRISEQFRAIKRYMSPTFPNPFFSSPLQPLTFKKTSLPPLNPSLQFLHREFSFCPPCSLLPSSLPPYLRHWFLRKPSYLSKSVIDALNLLPRASWTRRRDVSTDIAPVWKSLAAAVQLEVLIVLEPPWVSYRSFKLIFFLPY